MMSEVLSEIRKRIGEGNLMRSCGDPKNLAGVLSQSDNL